MALPPTPIFGKVVEAVPRQNMLPFVKSMAFANLVACIEDQKAPETANWAAIFWYCEATFRFNHGEGH